MDSPIHWVEFNLFVLFAIVLDLGVFHRRPHKIGLREALLWSAAWVALAIGFGALIFHFYGRELALEYYTGYLIEKSLSVDNLFVFLMIFQAFSVEPRFQQRVLGWGILGALLMRGAMIAAGAALVERFSWILYLFGAFLIYAGAQMLLTKERERHPEKNPLVRYVSQHLRMTKESHGEHFFVRESGCWNATPLLLVLFIIEIMDVTFALDSIPAIFGITRDPFIVYTSNVFAILGLRALYFLLAGVLKRLTYLKMALAIVLLFVGTKMIVEPWIHVPVVVSLAMVVLILALAIAASLLAGKKKEVQAGKSARSIVSHAQSVRQTRNASLASLVEKLSSPDAALRVAAASEIFRLGRTPAEDASQSWWSDSEFAALFGDAPRATVGVAVRPATFARIRAANGNSRLADVPPDQDAMEFELRLPNRVSLDILTTKAPGKGGAIARFLEKFGEGVQQVEFRCKNVDRATSILKEKFGVEALYPVTRPGADGTRVNFFLVGLPEGGKVLIELYEPGPIH